MLKPRIPISFPNRPVHAGILSPGLLKSPSQLEPVPIDNNGLLESGHVGKYDLSGRVNPDRLGSEATYFQPVSASITASGFSAAILSKARAGPSGLRRPCSQF